jgi:hypothetical protein
MSNRLLLGLHNGSYRFRVSKPGHDVLSADWPNLLFSEEQGVVRLLQSGTVQLQWEDDVIGATGVVNFVQTLFQPYLHWSYSQDGGATYAYPGNVFADNNPNPTNTAFVHVREFTNSYVKFQRPPSSPAGDLVRYVVFAEAF